MTEKRTISLPGKLYRQAMEQVESRAFGSFSDYVQTLIREDYERRRPDPGTQLPAHLRKEFEFPKTHTRLNENPTGYAGTPTQVSSRQAVDVAKGAGAAVAQAVLASQSRSQSDTTASPNESTPEPEPASPAESSPPQSPPK